MHLEQLVAHDAAEPQEQRQIGVLEIVVAMFRCLYEGILHHVRRVDAPAQARIHAKRDHSGQPFLVLHKHRSPCARIATPGHVTGGRMLGEGSVRFHLNGPIALRDVGETILSVWRH